MSILKHSDIDCKKINFKKPEKQGVIYYSPINYDNEPFYLQMPKMICRKEGTEILKKNSNIDMETINTDFSFYDFLLSLDDLNVKETFKNNKDWFGKDIPLELIDNMYKRSCKPVKKDKKPIFSFKIPIIKDKVQCQIYDQRKTCIEFNKLEGDCVLDGEYLDNLKLYLIFDIYIYKLL